MKGKLSLQVIYGYDYPFHQWGPMMTRTNSKSNWVFIEYLDKNTLSKYLLDGYWIKEWFGGLPKIPYGMPPVYLKKENEEIFFFSIRLTGFFCALQRFTIFIFHYRIHINNVLSFRLQIFQYCATFQSADIKLGEKNKIIITCVVIASLFSTIIKK